MRLLLRLLLLLLMLMLLLSLGLLLLLQLFPETKALSNSGVYVGRQPTPTHVPGQGAMKAVGVELMLLGVNESRRHSQMTGARGKLRGSSWRHRPVSPALGGCLEAGVLAMYSTGPSTAQRLIVLHGRHKLVWWLEQASQCHAVSVREVKAGREVLRGRWEAMGGV